jgi:hypothetical protein
MKKRNIFSYLSLDIIRKIYTFDSTYYEYFKINILPYINKKWIIWWTCKFTGKSGMDLTGINQCRLIDDILENEFVFTYSNCIKICKNLNQINSNFIHKPIMI